MKKLIERSNIKSRAIILVVMTILLGCAAEPIKTNIGMSQIELNANASKTNNGNLIPLDNYNLQQKYPGLNFFITNRSRYSQNLDDEQIYVFRNNALYLI